MEGEAGGRESYFYKKSASGKNYLQWKTKITHN